MYLRSMGLLAIAATTCLSLMGSPAMAQSRVLSTQGNERAAPANVLSTEGNEGAAPARVISTKDLATPEAVRKSFEERFPGIDIVAVKHTRFPGLYEVQVGMDLLYTDANVDYLMQGSLIDAKSRTDLTAERLEELSKVSFSSLPLELAVKQVKGDGSRQIAVFEDPNCGYCKRLHQTLKDVDNITVYTFLFPILSPDSTVKARNIWCAKDQAAAWRNWMLDGKVPAEANCETPVKTVLALGRKLMVQGTPAIIFADGSRVNGALPLDALKQKLDSVKTAK
ncbi:DsbC family protein [Pollutimonas sp. H1-120]|uniref:DsbC family protein n=1 Tax=Pollutimonas sp. H1-120 TaxID=3148824 RepID=UPI003B516234